MPGHSDKESRRTNLRSVPGWVLNEEMGHSSPGALADVDENGIIARNGDLETFPD